MMEAVCRGAVRWREENGGRSGLVVGVLPTASKSDANPHCDLVLPTGLGYARNVYGAWCLRKDACEMQATGSNADAINLAARVLAHRRVNGRTMDRCYRSYIHTYSHHLRFCLTHHPLCARLAVHSPVRLGSAQLARVKAPATHVHPYRARVQSEPDCCSPSYLT